MSRSILPRGTWRQRHSHSLTGCVTLILFYWHYCVISSLISIKEWYKLLLCRKLGYDKSASFVCINLYKSYTSKQFCWKCYSLVTLMFMPPINWHFECNWIAIFNKFSICFLAGIAVQLYGVMDYWEMCRTASTTCLNESLRPARG